MKALHHSVRCVATALRYKKRGKSSVGRCSRRATHRRLYCWQHERMIEQMNERYRAALAELPTVNAMIENIGDSGVNTRG